MSDPVVRTSSGAVRGFVEEQAAVFLGIPFAEPPFGARRFLPPERVAPWDGTREALAYGPTAPQRDPVTTIIPEPVERGDDCLNLNVYTPDPGDARLPVFVYIHGGGWVSGCNRSPWYRGTRFARDGVVVVTIGYRLGIEGFLDIEDAPPNRAVLDWLSALHWVQDNAAAFGGDPANVTIGGQSAGSAACLTLMVNPRAEGLFHRVIAMSGTSDTRMARSASRELAEKMAAHLGVSVTREAFSRFTPDDLIDAHAAVAANPFTAQALSTSFDPRLPALRPYVDGEVIPEHPYKTIAAGAGRDVALLAGSTAEELNGLIRMQRATFADRAGSGLKAMGLEGERLTRYLEHVRSADLVDAFAQACTDRSFRAPLADLLEDRAALGAPTHGYQFTWRSPVFDGVVGAAHCLDVPFVFDNLDAERVADGLIGPDAPQQLADRMHGAWVGFITNGDPGWPAYTKDDRLVMEFDERSDVAEDPLRIQREVFT
ncbi:MAG TPA: carboxylesterase family protein [Actinomycetota bacterium]|jgi:para-nitrobenzyl esterase|nr:carboxylesterase family protein [Actinomycetota bacterium]